MKCSGFPGPKACPLDGKSIAAWALNPTATNLDLCDKCFIRYLLDKTLELQLKLKEYEKGTLASG